MVAHRLSVSIWCSAQVDPTSQENSWALRVKTQRAPPPSLSLRWHRLRLFSAVHLKPSYHNLLFVLSMFFATSPQRKMAPGMAFRPALPYRESLLRQRRPGSGHTEAACPQGFPSGWGAQPPEEAGGEPRGGVPVCGSL